MLTEMGWDMDGRYWMHDADRKKGGKMRVVSMK
jgi:hypothetical protein